MTVAADPNTTPETLPCRLCRRDLPIRKFSKNKTRRSGHQGECKDCMHRQRCTGRRAIRVHIRPHWSRCSGPDGCGRDLPDDHFHKRPDGSPVSMCRPCRLAYDRERHRADRRINPERHRAYQETAAARKRERTKAVRATIAAERGMMAAWVTNRITSLIGDGWTVREIAHAIGVGRPTVYRWRSGALYPGPKSIEKLRRIR